jgi:anthraniloyl-CoA monooxygenase
MAMQDALALARAISTETTLDHALDRYEEQRHPEVDRIQEAARPSLSWWEHFGTYADHLPPLQFAYHFLTRSGRVDHRRLKEDDPGFVEEVERWFAERAQAPLHGRVIALEELPERTVRVTAPAGEQGLQEAFERAARAAREGAVPIAISPAAGAPEVEARLGATLLAERVRFELGVPILLEAPDLDESWATTMLLSGRADLVGVPAARLVDGAAPRLP